MSRSIGVDPTVQRLRALAAQGGQPAAMASAPTVSTGVNNAATTIPVGSTEYAWNSGNFNLLGGDWSSALGGTWPNNNASTGRTATWSTGTTYNANWYGGGLAVVECVCTGQYFEPKIAQISSRWRLVVDGEYVTLPVYTSGGVYRTLIDFGSAASRTIRLESISSQAADVKFMGASCESTATITATATPADRLLIVGDSFMGTTGLTDPAFAAGGLAYPISKELGFSDYWNSYIGGTGWEQAGVAPDKFNLDDRWTTDVVGADPTVAIIAVGLNDVNDGNDAAIEVMVAAKLDELRTAAPNCLVHVFGPYDVNAPGAPQTGFAGLQTALSNACAGKAKVWFHSLEGIAYTKSDATHPDTAGYATLHPVMYNKIAAIHGLHTVA